MSHFIIYSSKLYAKLCNEVVRIKKKYFWKKKLLNNIFKIYFIFITKCYSTFFSEDDHVPCSVVESTEPRRSGAKWRKCAYGASRSDPSRPGRSDAVLPSVV